MTKTNMQAINSSPNTFRWLSRITGLVILSLAVLLIFIRDENLKTGFYDILSPIQCALIAGLLFFTARVTSDSNPRRAESWRLWAIAFIFYALGDTCWAIIELILKVTPFPSIADIFYGLSYVFLWMGLARYPADSFSIRERSLMWLDNLVVMLGASLAYWVFLLNPMILTLGEVDFFSALLALAYPILDLLLLWMLLIFFRNRLKQSTYIPLVLMGFCLLSQIIADSFFAFKSVNVTFMSSFSTQLCWTVGLLFVIFACSTQLKSISTQTDQAQIIRQAHSFNSWPLYLPYIWLVISYGTLFTSNSMNSHTLPLYLVVGLIGGLVILRQVLTLNENERLFNQAQAELVERQQAQAALRQANFELDTRVKERTKELLAANEQLLQTNLGQEEALHEKEILLKEIHHRVKNNLQIISSLLNLQAGKVTDPHTIQALRESQARVRSMALIHEKLYQSDSLASIDFGGYVKSLATDLFRSYQRGLSGVQLKIEVVEVALELDQAVPCGLILNELMTNALKYAFPDGRNGTLRVELRARPGHVLSLRVADDGVGMPPEFNLATSKSLGLQLVHSLVAQLDGRLDMENTNGTTTFEVTFGYRYNDLMNIDSQRGSL